VEAARVHRWNQREINGINGKMRKMMFIIKWLNFPMGVWFKNKNNDGIILKR
jgi:hypothetical protein